MPWFKKNPDLTNNPLYLEPRVTANETQLAQKAAQSAVDVKADKSYVDDRFSLIGSASPKGTYATLTDLQTAFPSGNTNIYVVAADGKWYYWSGSAWTAGGTYQSTGVADGTVTPKQTSFMTASENIIDPSKRSDGKNLAYTYNVSTVDTYGTDATRTAYTESFTTTTGEIIYSNAPGRLVWYGSDNLVKGNTSFAFDSTLGLYKATVGSGGVKSKIDGYLSNINVAGYWFACKSTAYSGNPSKFGDTKLKDIVDSNIFGKKSDVVDLQTRVGKIEKPTDSTTFFVPHYLYCFDSVKSSKWIPKYNVMATKNYNGFYIDITAPKGALRDWDRVKTQDADTIAVKTTDNDAQVYSKVYNRRAINPATKTNPSTQKNVMIIGDSYSDNGYIPTDIKNQIVNTHGFTNVNFIGTKTDTLNGVTCLNEGRGGYTIDDFIKTDNIQGRGTTFPNPLLNNGTVSFADYMSRNGFSGNLDYVIIELGVNNIVVWNDSADTIKAKMQALIDKILASYPSCKIFVCGLVMVSKINSSYDCVYHNTFALNVNKSYEDLCESASYSANCVYVDTAVFFDSDYGFPYSFTPYRGSTEARKVQTDWLHPSEAGYYMMTDTIASAFIYHMS